jgi:DUF4097 and DUF4098 domain-containing protein YvlB
MKPILSNYRAAPQSLTAVIVIVLCWALSSPVQAQTTEANVTKGFTVKPGGQLVMDVDRGGIEITTGETSEVKVEVKRKITGVSGEKAQETFAAHEVTFDQDGDRVEVHAKFKKDFLQAFNKAAQKMQVHYEVLVPSKFNLDLRTSAGEISSSDIEGSVKARTAGGSLKFGEIKGPFEGTTSAGSINLAGATGVVTAKTSGGSISLGRLDSDTTAETSAGSISVKKANAKLAATTHGGNIDAGELDGAARVETSAGSITVKTAKEQLSAVTHGGKIEAGELGGPAQLETSAGSIKVGSVHGPLVANTSGGSIEIDQAADTVTAHTSAGSITAAFMAQPHGDCKLTTSGGGINVRLADNLGFDLDARTSGGRVITELPVTITVVGEHRNGTLKGKLNGGGKVLELKTSAGDIVLKK